MHKNGSRPRAPHRRCNRGLCRPANGRRTSGSREVLPPAPRSTALSDEVATILQIDSVFADILTEQAPASHRRQFIEQDLPERLSGNKVVSEIGAGGMGRVVLGVDERLDRKVAIKVLSSRYWADPQLRERFMQEARALAALHDHNIVVMYILC